MSDYGPRLRITKRRRPPPPLYGGGGRFFGGYGVWYGAVPGDREDDNDHLSEQFDGVGGEDGGGDGGDSGGGGGDGGGGGE